MPSTGDQMVGITREKKKRNETIIVTFHYAGVVLSLIPPWPCGPRGGVALWLARGAAAGDVQQRNRDGEKERGGGRVGQL